MANIRIRISLIAEWVFIYEEFGALQQMLTSITFLENH